MPPRPVTGIALLLLLVSKWKGKQEIHTNLTMGDNWVTFPLFAMSVAKVSKA
jgi:hypothetical protein